MKQSGKKAELIERVRDSRGLIKVDLNVDGGKWYGGKKKKIQLLIDLSKEKNNSPEKTGRLERLSIP